MLSSVGLKENQLVVSATHPQLKPVVYIELFVGVGDDTMPFQSVETIRYKQI